MGTTIKTEKLSRPNSVSEPWIVMVVVVLATATATAVVIDRRARDGVPLKAILPIPNLLRSFLLELERSRAEHEKRHNVAHMKRITDGHGNTLHYGNARLICSSARVFVGMRRCRIGLLHPDPRHRPHSAPLSSLTVIHNFSRCGGAATAPSEWSLSGGK